MSDPEEDSFPLSFALAGLPRIYGAPVSVCDALVVYPGIPLFARGTGDLDFAAPTDIAQGHVGDCWLLASISALASKAPWHIRSMISMDSPHTFSVLFGNITIKVSTFLPFISGRPIGADPGHGGELWVALLEKAFVKYLSVPECPVREAVAYATRKRLSAGIKQRFPAYLDIHGGNPEWALRGLLGLASAYPTTIRTPFADDFLLHALLQDTSALTIAVASTDSSKDDSHVEDGVVYGHSYSVLGHSGGKSIMVYNPWGKVEPGSDGRDDGKFEISYETLRLKFPLLSVIRLHR